MTTDQIILTAISVVVVPCVVAEVRYRVRLQNRLIKIEEFNSFVSRFLLKNAVLEFHNNPNPQTDRIIEKINADEPITHEEMEELTAKLKRVAGGDDTKKKFKAEATLELMKWIFDEDFQTSVNERVKTRNRLFSE